MDRLRYISRPLSTSIYTSSKYRWGKHDLAMPKLPKRDKVGQNIMRIEGNHRLKLEAMAVKQKRYLERGAAQDYSAEMTVSKKLNFYVGKNCVGSIKIKLNVINNTDRLVNVFKRLCISGACYKHACLLLASRKLSSS